MEFDKKNSTHRYFWAFLVVMERKLNKRNSWRPGHLTVGLVNVVVSCNENRLRQDVPIAMLKYQFNVVIVMTFCLPLSTVYTIHQISSMTIACAFDLSQYSYVSCLCRGVIIIYQLVQALQMIRNERASSRLKSYTYN